MSDAPLASEHLLGAAAALTGVEDDAVVDFAQRFRAVAGPIRAWQVRVPPSLVGFTLTLEPERGPPDRTLEALAAAEGKPDLAPRLARALEGAFDLPDRGGARASIAFGQERSDRGLTLTSMWAPIVSQDAVDLLGDPWGARGRFVSRFTPFDGHGTLAATLRDGTLRYELVREVTFRTPEDTAPLAEAIAATLEDGLPSTGEATARVRAYAAYIRQNFRTFNPDGLTRRVSVRLGWPEGMPPDEVTVDFHAIPLPFAVSVVLAAGLPVASTDRLGTLVGLCGAPPEHDTLWFDLFRLRMPAHATFQMALGLTIDGPGAAR